MRNTYISHPKIVIGSFNFEEWYKNVFSFVELGRGVGNVWTNILFFHYVDFRLITRVENNLSWLGWGNIFTPNMDSCAIYKK